MEVLFVHLARKVDSLRKGEKNATSDCSISCSIWRAMMAEFIGTMCLVLIGCGVAITTKDTEEGIIKIALAFGLGAIASVQMIGHISGGHINPAVTVASVISLDTGFLRGLCYVISQSAGGIAGAAILLGTVPSAVSTSLGSTVPAPSVTYWQAFGVEFVLTYILVFANAAISDSNAHVAGHTSLPTGLIIAGLHLLGIPLTGCGINPARSLGPAVISGTWTHHWVYWGGPIGGAILASLSYKYLLSPYRHLPSVEEAIEKVVHSDPILATIRDLSTQSQLATVNKSLPSRGRTLWERPDIPSVYRPGSEYEIIPHLLTEDRV
ncbi:lens fiber major intrinsic protein-like [Liolophura sinensis]|uniref:lens fiber major intrinsic protein-like n=1 Tax=Liolophura sinensis TaxID=3198878 RepID=UPI0031591721